MNPWVVMASMVVGATLPVLGAGLYHRFVRPDVPSSEELKGMIIQTIEDSLDEGLYELSQQGEDDD